jgi:AraC family ethanolamine operon transcriptional activator
LNEFATSVGQIESADVDECAESHAPWEMRHTQLSLGKFRSLTHCVRNDRVIVYRQSWNQKVLARGTSPAGYVVVGTTTTPSTDINWCGVDLSRERWAWTPPSGEIDFITSERSSHVVALIRADVLASYLGDADPATEERALHIHCPERNGNEMVATIQSILMRYAHQPDLLDDPRESQDFESEVLGALAGCANWGPLPDDSAPRRTEILRGAAAHVERVPNRITVPQLAEAVGVSRRTLEVAFREGLNITPLQFMRRSRMNRALHTLRVVTPDSITVTEVATKLGFTDLGRFAADYRNLFGLNPSQTLGIDPTPPTERLRP